MITWRWLWQWPSCDLWTIQKIYSEDTMERLMHCFWKAYSYLVWFEQICEFCDFHDFAMDVTLSSSWPVAFDAIRRLKFTFHIAMETVCLGYIVFMPFHQYHVLELIWMVLLATANLLKFRPRRFHSEWPQVVSFSAAISACEKGHCPRTAFANNGEVM